jgi:hypothetical protein
MNRLVTLLALAIALGSPASAQTFYPTSSGQVVAAGEVNFDGTVLVGTGFTARRISTGKYRIVFHNGLSCPLMSVTDVGRTSNPPTPEVFKTSACSPVYFVHFFLAGYASPLDQTFQFVAVTQ